NHLRRFETSRLVVRLDSGTSAFFFASRSRHTWWPRDWSSDVCSSDLLVGAGRGPDQHRPGDRARSRRRRGRRRGGGGTSSVAGRSEERRVGKECRTRWARHHYKKTKYANCLG